MENDKHSDELLELLRSLEIANRITRLQLTTWRTVTKAPLAEYFPSVGALEVADTRPTHVADYRDQIGRYPISMSAHKSSDWRLLSEIDRYDYTMHVLSNAAKLSELYVRTEIADTFDYFRRVADVLKAPNLDKIHLLFHNNGRGPHYIVTYGKGSKADHRELVAWNASQIAETMAHDKNKVRDRLKIDYLNLVVQNKADAGILAEILAIMNKNLVADTMSDIVRVFHNVAEFLLKEIGDRDSIRKFIDDQKRTVLVANIKSALFTNVEKVQLTLDNANDDSLAEFAEWLVQLDDVVELTIEDEQSRFLEMALAKCLDRTLKRVDTWPKLEKLSAPITVFDDELLKSKFSADRLNQVQDWQMTGSDRKILT